MNESQLHSSEVAKRNPALVWIVVSLVGFGLLGAAWMLNNHHVPRSNGDPIVESGEASKGYTPEPQRADAPVAASAGPDAPAGGAYLDLALSADAADLVERLMDRARAGDAEALTVLADELGICEAIDKPSYQSLVDNLPDDARERALAAAAKRREFCSARSLDYLALAMELGKLSKEAEARINPAGLEEIGSIHSPAEFYLALKKWTGGQSGLQ